MEPGLKLSNSERQQFIEAIDNLFLKIELSYHYQFYKVFGSDERLREAKRLWAQSLKKYPAACIDSAIEIVIQTNEYLPTLTEILRACEDSMGSINIPNAPEAFIEAQKSSAPRQEHPWTTPIIYWAAKETGWDLINSSNNLHALKIFSKIYWRLAKEMQAGKSFAILDKEPEEKREPLDLELLKSLRAKHIL